MTPALKTAAHMYMFFAAYTVVTQLAVLWQHYQVTSLEQQVHGWNHILAFSDYEAELGLK